MAFYRKIHNRRTIFVTLIVACALILPLQAAGAQAPVIHAILFFSPSCPHCHEVMKNDLPPLHEKYGDQLDILVVDTTQIEGAELYQEAVEKFNITEDRQGVPAMIVGDTVLVGSREIPGLFPSIIEKGLAQGGIPFPEMEKLGVLLNKQTPVAEPTFLDKMNRDIVGNGLSVLVLLGLVIVFLNNATLFYQKTIQKKDYKKILAENTSSGPNWFYLLLLIAGIGVATYLAYVEMTQSDAICGPVGDCNTVQQSPYATLFGILPIGLFGLFGYVLLALAWLVQSFGSARLRSYAALAAFVFSFFGIAFSIYLTFLEPFVIGATCAWCLSSAIIMGILFWMTTKPAVAAWHQLRAPARHSGKVKHA